MIPGVSWDLSECSHCDQPGLPSRRLACTDMRTIVELIAATSTTNGLTDQAAYDPNWYPRGVEIIDDELAAIAHAPHDWHREWNYTIAPSIPR